MNRKEVFAIGHKAAAAFAGLVLAAGLAAAAPVHALLPPLPVNPTDQECHDFINQMFFRHAPVAAIARVVTGAGPCADFFARGVERDREERRNKI